jgi:hypothetical protein
MAIFELVVDDNLAWAELAKTSLPGVHFFDSMSTVGPGENLDEKFNWKILSKI